MEAVVEPMKIIEALAAAFAADPTETIIVSETVVSAVPTQLPLISWTTGPRQMFLNFELW